MENILKELSISKENYGACIGGESWIETKDQGAIESINPSNGEILANETLHFASDNGFSI